jgi:hypothetical protein
MRKLFSLRRNSDGTVTFRCERYVEHFSVKDKTYVETYEAIRWGCLTAGLELQQDTLEELLREVRNLR